MFTKKYASCQSQTLLICALLLVCFNVAEGYLQISDDTIGVLQPRSLPEILTLTGIDTWHEAGYLGQDQKIGILLRDGRGVEQVATDDDITITQLPGSAAPGEQSQGAAMLHVIHTVAPEANLFYCQYNNLATFTLCIDYLIGNEIHIVAHEGLFPATLPATENPWTREAERAVREGDITWVNAAGNFADSVITEVFRDTDVDGLHEFPDRSGVTESLQLPIVDEQAARVSLTWQGADQEPASAFDFDILVFNEDGERIILEDPWRLEDDVLMSESLVLSLDTPLELQIRSNSDSPAITQVRFYLGIEFTNILTGTKTQSITAPGDSPSVLTVGALQGLDVAEYSSRGPLRDGSIKPDIIAPGEIIVDDEVIIGSGISTAFVASAAALIRSANPELSQIEIRERLVNSSLDVLPPGQDSFSGRGRFLMADPQAALVPPPIIPTPPQESNLAREEEVVRRCDGAPPARLVVDTFGIIGYRTFDSLNLRSGPSTSADIIGQALPYQSFRVLEGPECANEYNWYLIDYGGADPAWVAEGTLLDGEADYFVMPLGANVSTQDSNWVSCHDDNFFFGPASGCPRSASETVYGAYQPFEQGQMIWFSDTDAFFVLHNDGSWRVFQRSAIDTFPDNPIGDAPPDGLISPISGFGRIWGSVRDIRDRIGWGLQREFGHDFVRQRVDLYSLPGSQHTLFYLALPDGSIIALGINAEGPFWQSLN